MDSETTDPPMEEPPGQDLARHAAGIAYDMARMVELQAQLLAADARSLRNGMVRGAIAWFLAAAIGAATVPVLLAGLGLWLAQAADLSPATGLIGVAVLGAVLASGIAVWGWTIFQQQSAEAERSRRELAANFAALKQVLAAYARRDPDSPT